MAKSLIHGQSRANSTSKGVINMWPLVCSSPSSWVRGWRRENYAELLLGTVIVAVACHFPFSGRFFWVLTIASSFLGGTFPILGGQFTPFQILMAIGGSRSSSSVTLSCRRTKLKLGTRVDALLDRRIHGNHHLAWRPRSFRDAFPGIECLGRQKLCKRIRWPGSVRGDPEHPHEAESIGPNCPMLSWG